MTNAKTLPKLVGERVRRREDPRLITGLGTYVDDIKLPGMLHMNIVRSTHAHARATQRRHLRCEGSRGSRAGDDRHRGACLGEMLPTASNLPEMKAATRYPLTADGFVRFVGEGIAAVVAQDRYQAADAAELVDIDYEDLPVVVDALKAMEPGAQVLHETHGTNVCVSMPFGDQEATDAAFRDADVTIKQWMVNHRLVPNAMEPRGVVAHFDPGLETLTLWSSTQVPHLLRSLLSGLVRVPEHKIRVIAPEVGGGFGSKIDVYPEDILVALASIHLRKPVKWIETRSENFQATIHGRDIHAEVELAARSDGKLLAQRIKIIADIGAYQQLLNGDDPHADSADAARPLQGTGAARDADRGLHQQDAHGRLPRRRPPGGLLLHRAWHGHAGEEAQHGPGGATPA